jgi:hypothetical protein
MRLRERSCTSDGRCTRPRCRIQSEEWVAALCAHGAERDWIHVKTQLLSLFRAKVTAGSAPEPSDDMSTKIKDLIFSESTLTDQQTIKLYQNLDDDRLSDVFSTGVAIDC